MRIRLANENDLTAWCELATEVSRVFRHPADMGKDPEFISYAKSKTSKNEALTVTDDTSGKNMGFIGFSRTYNRITWFAVSAEYRGKGVGSILLKNALMQLDHTKPITVETYPEGYGPGVPAKNIYRKFGFVETESNLTGPHNLPICKMTIENSCEKHSGSFHCRDPKAIKEAQKENCPPSGNKFENQILR